MSIRHIRAVVAVAGVCLMLGAGASAQQVIRVEPRDQLNVSVWNNGVSEASYTGKFVVDADGTFEYPTIGRVKVVGLTAREIEADLKTRLSKDLVAPQVTVEVEQVTSKTVIMANGVRMPASYQFASTTLLGAITRAGGLADDAGDVAIIHRVAATGDGEEVLTVELADLLSGKSMQNNVPIKDGDTVVIPKSEPVFVYGNVGSQGAIYVKTGTTVQQALSMAGGVTDRGSTSGIKIQRVVDGEKQEIKVKDITKDLVKPGDTIVVPARRF